MDEALARRLTAIEEQLQHLDWRLGRLERAEPAPRPAPASTPPSAPLSAPAPARASAPLRLPPLEPLGVPPPARLLGRPASESFEELFGGRLLGWLGGIAVALGVVFFVATAIHRGWIDETTRVVLAFLGSTALLGVGLWLYERRGQTEAALATVAASIAALYATATAATTLYDLISPPPGLVLAGLIGMAATLIAVRWDSEVVAGIGLVGALLAPVLVDSGTSTIALLFVGIALIATVGVLLWRRWNWLAGAAFVVTVPQLLDWMYEERSSRLAVALVVLAVFWLLYVLAAAGYELRVPTENLRLSSALLLFANAVLVSGAGWGILNDQGHEAWATGWVIAAAALHVLLGIPPLSTRMSSEIGFLLIALGVALSAIGLTLAVSGPALVTGWAVEAVVLAWLGRRSSLERASAASIAFLVLAIMHALSLEAPPSALLDGVDDLGTVVAALGVLTVASISMAVLGRSELLPWRPALLGVAAALGVYLGSIVIVDLTGPGQSAQLALSAFLATVGLLALVGGLVRDVQEIRLGGLVLLGLTIAKVFLYDLAKLDSIYRVVSFVAVGLLLLAGAFAYQRVRGSVGSDRA